jgi:FixJ family two-component response regulator
MTSIYILDDNSSIRSSLEILFASLFNTDIMTYARVEDFYAHVDRRTSGLLLVDHQMPECTGIEVMRTLSRRADRRLAMVLMSGSVDVSLIDEAKAAGAAAVIEKPCSTDTLRQLVQRSRPRIPLRSASIAKPGSTTPYAFPALKIGPAPSRTPQLIP